MLLFRFILFFLFWLRNVGHKQEKLPNINNKYGHFNWKNRIVYFRSAGIHKYLYKCCIEINNILPNKLISINKRNGIHRIRLEQTCVSAFTEKLMDHLTACWLELELYDLELAICQLFFFSYFSRTSNLTGFIFKSRNCAFCSSVLNLSSRLKCQSHRLWFGHEFFFFAIVNHLISFTFAKQVLTVNIFNQNEEKYKNWIF